MTFLKSLSRPFAAAILATIAFGSGLAMADQVPSAELAGRGPARPVSAFGSVPVSMARTAQTDRWQKLLSEGAGAQLAQQCGSECPTAAHAELSAVIDVSEGKGWVERIQTINSAANRTIEYSSDGAGDRWATLAETLASGRGDCEDIAIVKMWMLRAAGVPAEAIHLVLLRDTRRGMDHAVIMVRLDGRNLILDNLSDELRTEAAVRHYRPLISLAADGAWIHGFRPGEAPGSAVAAAAQ